MLVVFTNKRYSDRYLLQAVRKGFVKIPSDKESIKDKTLFVFDDVTPLGIVYPRDLILALGERNSPLELIQAQELASSLVRVLPVTDKLTVLDGGGVLSYLFLKKAGYTGQKQEVVRVIREYPQGKPVCRLVDSPNVSSNLILDDILASGQTLTTVTSVFPSGELDVACLMASANVPRGIAGYRRREGSTISGVRRLYCGQLVNGLMDENKNNRKPAILSLRYLLTKAVDQGDYTKTYLAKKFGGIEKAGEICSLLSEVNREPIDLLRKDPKAFLAAYGVK